MTRTSTRFVKNEMPMQEINQPVPSAPHPSTQMLHWSSLRTELLWIYEGLVPSYSLQVTTDHRFGYWAWLLQEGSVHVTMGNQSWTAHEGQWLVPPQGLMTQEYSPNARILSVHFRCQWPTGENLFSETDGLVLEASDFPNLTRSASRLASLVHRHFPEVKLEFLQQTADYRLFLKVEQRFLQWLIDFFDMMIQQKRTWSRGGAGDERLSRAAEVLHSNPLDSSFPAVQLQQATSLGRTQLDRLFWKAFGTTTREYWEMLRQESAISSLDVDTLSIKEIGYRLGFKQPSHFTKWFSRRVGVTPHDYRSNSSQGVQFKLEKTPAAVSAAARKSKFPQDESGQKKKANGRKPKAAKRKKKS